MGNRPEWCSRCVFEDCMLTDHMAQSEVSAALQGLRNLTFLENKSRNISNIIK